MEELTRSVVGETMKPLNILEVEGKVIKDSADVYKVREMGAYKTLTTFKSVEAMEKAVNTSEGYLYKYFGEIRR